MTNLRSSSIRSGWSANPFAKAANEQPGYAQRE
jgi:hypothetical protein